MENILNCPTSRISGSVAPSWMFGSASVHLYILDRELRYQGQYDEGWFVKVIYGLMTNLEKVPNYKTCINGVYIRVKFDYRIVFLNI